jgi:hypothetical protein
MESKESTTQDLQNPLQGLGAELLVAEKKLGQFSDLPGHGDIRSTKISDKEWQE